MNRRRILLTGVFLLISLGAVAVYLATSSVRNAPLTLGDGTTRTTSEETEIAPSEGVPLAPPPYTLAFTTDVEGHWDIALLESDGVLKNLTADGTDAQDYFPSFALAGDMINFISSRGSPTELGPSQVQSSGEGLRSLSIVSAVITLFGEGRLDWDPSWSPNGTQVLWSSLRDLNLELYTIPTDAEFAISNATRLTNTGARDWFGAWSPDGAQVAFATDRNGNEDIYVIPTTGGEALRLTDSPVDDIHAMWSLDGTQLAFVYDENDTALLEGRVLIYVTSPDGNGTPEPLEVVFIGDPVTSPDGAYVAYVSNETGNWHIYVMNSDGSNVRRVTDGDANYLFPVWQP